MSTREDFGCVDGREDSEAHHGQCSPFQPLRALAHGNARMFVVRVLDRPARKRGCRAPVRLV